MVIDIYNTTWQIQFEVVLKSKPDVFATSVLDVILTSVLDVVLYIIFNVYAMSVRPLGTSCELQDKSASKHLAAHFCLQDLPSDIRTQADWATGGQGKTLSQDISLYKDNPMIITCPNTFGLGKCTHIISDHEINESHIHLSLTP